VRFFRAFGGLIVKARNLAICVFSILCALAAATVIITSNVHGEGRAVNGDGRVGYFFMDVTKVSHNDNSSVRGSFRFNSAVESRSVAISMPLPDEAAFNENVSNFAGPAVLRIQVGTEVHEYRGRVHVTATSNRHLNEAGDPDAIEVNFLPAVQDNPQFHFAGHLTGGDIAVTTTRSY
jgi:hypothetical protein